MGRDIGHREPRSAPLAGLGTLDGVTQTKPALYSVPASAFTDITEGSNDFQLAGPGYYLTTGIGTPVANQLVPYLSSYGASASVATGPTVSTGSAGASGTVSTSGTVGTTSSPSVIFPVTAPAFSATAVSSTQVRLFWSTSIYAIGYNVYQFVNGTPTIVANVPAGTTSVTIGNLAAATQYAFNLVAYNTISSAGTAWVVPYFCFTGFDHAAAEFPIEPGIGESNHALLDLGDRPERLHAVSVSERFGAGHRFVRAWHYQRHREKPDAEHSLSVQPRGLE